MTRRVYVDASIVVTYLMANRHPDVVRQCGELLEADGITRVTCALMWDEVVHKTRKWPPGAPEQPGKRPPFTLQYAQQVSARLLDLPIEFCDVQARDVRVAGELLRTGLRPRDAIHAAVSLRTTSGVLVTADQDFRRVIWPDHLPVKVVTVDEDTDVAAALRG